MMSDWINGEMGLRVRQTAEESYEIDLGYATGLRIIPVSLLEAFLPGGVDYYVSRSDRRPVRIDDFLFKPLGPYDSLENELGRVGFKEGFDFSWLVGPKPGSTDDIGG